MAAERRGALALLVLALVVRVSATCPALCECKWRSGKESALCPRAGLLAVPARLPPTTQLLDLSENRISSLRDDAFAAVGLLDLQRLYLVSCGLRAIRPAAFRALVNLVELDLSRNKLENVPSHAFAPVPELRELKLAGNHLAKLKDDAFSKLVHLVRLDLSSCRIVEIEPRAFFGVEASLEYLDLDKNLLRSLHVASVAPLRSLKGLELFGNPWECTCGLRPLRDWMVRKNVPATVTPECASPPRLMSVSWDRLDLDDYACPPEVDPLTEHASGYEGGEVTLACRVSGMPSPRVRWSRSGRLISNQSGLAAASTSGRTFVLRGEGQLSKLIIKAADSHDAGSYTCSGENKAGRAEAHMTLAIDRSPPSGNLGDRVLLAGVAVSAGVLMCASLAFLYIFEIRKRRRSVNWNEQIVNQNHRDENYEKVVSNCKNGDSEIPAVSVEGGRKRGVYRNVPLQESEDETETFEDRWPPPQPEPPRWSARTPHEPDLHIPRRISINLRRETPQGSSSNSSTVGKSSITTENRFNSNPHPLHPVRTKPRERLDNDFSGSDSEKNYPDLIEMSSLGPSYVRTDEPERRPDPPSYFCTLPRKRNGDSRSPLLNSRRNSSGGDSNISYERSYELRMQQKSNRRSNSFLDLAGGGSRMFRNPSLPTSPSREPANVPSATPLLDLSGLRDFHIEDYDYRASQLEKFLEEYQNLREHLKVIKETRESIQRTRASDNDDLKSILKIKPSVAVTEASSTALADAASPLSLTTADYKPPIRTDWLNTPLYRT